MSFLLKWDVNKRVLEKYIFNQSTDMKISCRSRKRVTSNKARSNCFRDTFTKNVKSRKSMSNEYRGTSINFKN